MKIRHARENDLAEIEKCARESYALYVPRMNKPPAPMVADFKTLIENRMVHCIERNQGIIGFIILYSQIDHLHIENVAVHPESQGQGFGKRLIEFAEQEARRLRLAAIELYTNEAMTENFSFYGNLGFKEYERRDEDGFKRVFFRKEL